MLSSGDLDLRSGTRDFLFLLEAGLRGLGAGVRSPGSGVGWLRISASGIYIHLLPINRPCGRYVIIWRWMKWLYPVYRVEQKVVAGSRR